jgi:hypothetical protein
MLAGLERQAVKLKSSPQTAGGGRGGMAVPDLSMAQAGINAAAAKTGAESPVGRQAQALHMLSPASEAPVLTCQVPGVAAAAAGTRRTLGWRRASQLWPGQAMLWSGGAHRRPPLAGLVRVVVLCALALRVCRMPRPRCRMVLHRTEAGRLQVNALWCDTADATRSTRGLRAGAPRSARRHRDRHRADPAAAARHRRQQLQAWTRSKPQRMKRTRRRRRRQRAQGLGWIPAGRYTAGSRPGCRTVQMQSARRSSTRVRPQRAALPGPRRCVRVRDATARSQVTERGRRSTAGGGTDQGPPSTPPHSPHIASALGAGPAG